MAGEYTLDGLAVPDSLGALHDLLEKVADEHPDVAANDLMLFELAVIEIAGNVVEHGRPPGEVRYVFELAVRADRLEAVLSDTGEEVPDLSGPRDMPDDWEEAGRGLPLARASLDELSYARGPGSNHWRMVKLCTRDPQGRQQGAGSTVRTSSPPEGR